MKKALPAGIEPLLGRGLECVQNIFNNVIHAFLNVFIWGIFAFTAV
jgi:hypothetical protein